ncbi:MAG: phosphoglycerate dehydrogenase [Nitrospiraceae bacterium]|nr:MAG: phosphoglycerate dehydrogenase [Nitrospiraceae bacterium]
MKFKVLITAPYMQRELENYGEVFRKHNVEIVVPEVKERLSEAELLRVIGDIDGVIAGDDQFTARVLESAPRLKVLSKWGTGTDSFDKAAAGRLGIAIRNTPGAFNEPVADQVLGYMLAFARQIPWIDRRMKDGEWSKIPCFSLAQRTLGVIGVGDTGKAVIRRAQAFQMRLLGNDVKEMPAGFIRETGIEMVDKEVLLRESDFVSLNCDLNPTSYHIMGRHEFERMKEIAYFINAARGPLVDEPALIEALQKGCLRGAALDVFEDEPLPQGSPLRTMTNVLLSPHNANSSPEHWKRIHESTIANLMDELRKERAAVG